MKNTQHLRTSIPYGDFFSRVGDKDLKIEFQKFVVEKYLVREAVLRIFVGGNSKKICLNEAVNTVRGECGGVDFEFIITPSPNYQKTITADFQAEKAD
ncbi:hypothetical protein KKF38_02095 [Patescibacteria group bacterium]|nr:hypothetical protein [Patescibacteria group bacterium]